MNHWMSAKAADKANSAPSCNNEDRIGQLLELLKQTARFDFTEYQRSDVVGRIADRMAWLGISHVAAYIEYLQRTPEESANLCQFIWINVTSFFRDPYVWDRLSARVLPDMLASTKGKRPLRIWSAGCSTGQEAYSIALLIAGMFGAEGLGEHVQIVATDVNGQSLARARRGIFEDIHLGGVPASLSEEFFEPVKGAWRIRRELRRIISFRRMNLLKTRPTGSFDLVVCRNTLIAFQPAAQRNVLIRLRRALSNEGYLLLGPSECLIHNDLGFSYGYRFSTADVEAHLYRRSWIWEPKSPENGTTAIDRPSLLTRNGSRSII